jgi:hypothetical protein
MRDSSGQEALGSIGERNPIDVCGREGSGHSANVSSQHADQHMRRGDSAIATGARNGESAHQRAL